MTHDIEEALLLGNRIVYMSEGKITNEIRIDVPRSQRQDEASMERMDALKNELLGSGSKIKNSLTSKLHMVKYYRIFL